MTMTMEEALKKLVFSVFYIAAFLPFSAPDQCDPKARPDPRSLRSDQVTVLINGYSELRIPLLTKIAGSYAASPIVAKVVVLWGNPETAQSTVDSVSWNLRYTSVRVIRQKSSSLNGRFLPRGWIKTRGVVICDDDVEVEAKSVEFAFKVWQGNEDRLIGVFGRSHGLDIKRREWIYSVDSERYSIVLTKFMMLSLDYLYSYSCDSDYDYGELRGVVDRMRNCEDILMNFVVADVTDRGPLLVDAGRGRGVRDWGDARNEDVDVDVGLSGLKRGGGEHRRRRGQCIKEFHKILGRMPLRYSYGKMVFSINEQALCNKRGQLLPCDQQIQH